MLTYTTTEAVGRRLRGRLETDGPLLAYGNPVVDPDLIEQVGAQVESRVEAKLRTVYKLPFKSVSPIVASIVEKLILCELIPVHFAAELASNADSPLLGFAGLMCKQGGKELGELLSGEVTLSGEDLVSGGGSALSGGLTVAKQRNVRPLGAESIKW